MTTPKGPKITANDRLGFTFFVAVVAHLIIILGVGFTTSNATPADALPSLDVILSNSKSQEVPEDADFLSQSNQNGGGNQDEKRRPGAPVSAEIPTPQQGLADRQQQQLRANRVQLEKIYYINQRESDRRIEQAEQSDQPTNAQDSNSNIELQRLEIASLQAEIRKMTETYARRPRELALTARTKEAVEAGYLAQWVNRIEAIGNLNYPAEAEVRNLNGSLRLNVRINASGQVIDMKVSRSSGESVLDQAARRIVRLASPFAPFPEKLLEKADQIVIVRTWEFQSNKLTTEGGM